MSEPNPSVAFFEIESYQFLPLDADGIRSTLARIRAFLERDVAGSALHVCHFGSAIAGAPAVRIKNLIRSLRAEIISHPSPSSLLLYTASGNAVVINFWGGHHSIMEGDVPNHAPASKVTTLKDDLVEDDLVEDDDGSTEDDKDDTTSSKSGRTAGSGNGNNDSSFQSGGSSFNDAGDFPLSQEVMGLNDLMDEFNLDFPEEEE